MSGWPVLGGAAPIGGRGRFPADHAPVLGRRRGAATGVPNRPLDLARGVTSWWGADWANPRSRNFVPIGALRGPGRRVDVGPSEDLNAAAAAEPDGTTLVLAAGGAYGSVSLIGRRSLAFVPADPANRPTVTGGFTYLANATAVDYSDYVAAVVAGGAARATFLSLPGDILIRNIDLVSDGTVMRPTDATQDHVGLPWNFVGINRLVIEGCTTTGYKAGDAAGAEVAPFGHPGLLSVIGGCESVVFRGNTLAHTTNAGGFGVPYFVYLDGPRQCVIAGNVCSGKQHAAAFTVLANDDFSYAAWAGDAGWDPGDYRQGQLVAIADNTILSHSPAGIWFNGRNSLIQGNRWAGQTASVPFLIDHNVKCLAQTSPAGGEYDNTGLVVRANDVLGGGFTTGLVRSRNTDATACEFPVGGATVEGNRVTGTVAAWVADNVGNAYATVPPVSTTGNLAGWVP